MGLSHAEWKGLRARMIEAITCLAATHDPWLVPLAGLMCGAGALSVMQLFRRAAADRGLAAFG